MTLTPHDYKPVPAVGKYHRTYRPTGAAATSTSYAAAVPTDPTVLLYPLVATWTHETAFDSDPAVIFAHPAYRAIVDLGQMMVPAIIADLMRRPSLLVYAMEDIIGEAVYPPEAEGNLAAMTAAWLEWADVHGMAA